MTPKQQTTYMVIQYHKLLSYFRSTAAILDAYENAFVTFLTCQFSIVHGQFELNRKCAEIFDDLNTHDMKISALTSTSNESSHVIVRSTSNFIVIAIERVFP